MAGVLWKTTTVGVTDDAQMCLIVAPPQRQQQQQLAVPTAATICLRHRASDLKAEQARLFINIKIVDVDIIAVSS